MFDLTSSDLNIIFWTIAVGIACNVPCAILGVYLVLRRMSLLGDAISHAVLPGIAVGFLLTGSLIGPGVVLGAMAIGMLTAFLTHTLHEFGKVPEDASMGVVFTSLFALGVLLITNAAYNVDLDPGCVLYGLIEFTPLDTIAVFGLEVPRAFGTLGLATFATIAFVALFWKELKLASFDPMLATAIGLNATLIHYALMAMVAGVTVAAFEAVGSILVVAMLIVPAATAHLLTDRLGAMMLWAVVVGVVSAVVGYALAVVWNTSVAGMMAVAAGLQFALAVIAAPRHGVVAKAMHNGWLTIRIACEDVLAHLFRAEESQGPGSGRAESECLERARASGGRLLGPLALVRLRRLGQVARADDGTLRLTDPGRTVAHSLVRSHRLWEAYLNTHFQLPDDHLHEPAERLEHFIGPALQEELAAELDRPQADPHGRTIPPQASTDS